MGGLAYDKTKINEILQDLINTGEMTSFINDVIVKIKEEEWYDKLVKKIVKRLAENNLYMKQEHKWTDFNKLSYIGKFQIMAIYIYVRYTKSDNRLLRYQTISSYKFYWPLS